MGALRGWTALLAHVVARLRVRVADRLATPLLGEVAARVTDHTVRSLEEHAWRPEVARHLDGLTPWRCPALVTYDLADDLPPGFRRARAFDARPLADLRDVVVSPTSGMVWTDEVVLEESVGSLHRLLGWADLRHELLRRPGTVRAEGPLVPLPPTPFFHFLTETLPAAVAALGHRPGAGLLMPPDPPAYVTDAAAWLADVGLASAPPVVATGPVRVEALVLAAHEPLSGFIHPDDVALLRDTLGGDLPAAGHRRIYVSRRLAAARSLAGEAALETALRGVEVTPVVLEELDLRAQARTLAEAAVVVAPHGAGLAHLVWAAPGTTVVEVFPHGFVNDCYARLCASLGLAHHAVWADPDGTVDTAAVLAHVPDPPSATADPGKASRDIS